MEDKGEKFELSVKKIIDDIIARLQPELAGKFRAEVMRHPRLMGLSTEWNPDLVLMGTSLFDLEPSLELAVFECKYIDEDSSEGTYWSQMSRAYMSMNDLNLIYRGYLQFYFVVNRYGKSKKRDYRKVFKNIGVKMANINNSEERAEFEKDIQDLLQETTFEKQEEKLRRIFEEKRQK